MKKATSRDVAKLAGVSQTTVSFVINNTPNVSVSEETRKKVLYAARELNYVPNSFAKGLKTKKSKLIGLIVPTMINPFYPMLAQKIQEYASAKGYSVLLCSTNRIPEKEQEYLELLVEKSVDGIIYTFTPHFLSKVTRLSQQIPIVLVGEKSDKINLNTISLNGFRSGQLVAQHLVELGHRKIAYIMSPVTTVSLARVKRLEGIRATLREHGLENGLIVRTASYDGFNEGKLEIEAGYQLASELIRETDITAIIGVNDMVALGVVSCILNEGKLRIPDDISVCGFDNIYLSDMIRPKITTVDYFTIYQCKLAVDMLIENPSNDFTDVLKVENEPRLIKRESTGPAKTRS